MEVTQKNSSRITPVKPQYMFNLETICEEFHKKHKKDWGPLKQPINLKNLEARIENEEWTQTDPDIGRKSGNGSINTMRGATTQAQFSKGQNSWGLNVAMNITAKSDYSPTVRVYLQKGLVTGLYKELFLNFDPAIRQIFGLGVSINPSKVFREDRIPRQSKVQTSSNNMGREVGDSTAVVSSYQEAYSGRFKCDVVLSGTVVFQAQDGTSQQYISDIMRGRNDTTIRGKDVIWQMEGECELRKDAEPQINWI